MKYDRYEIGSTPDKVFYWFKSTKISREGLKLAGTDVLKIVEMLPMMEVGRVNLALADVINGDLNYTGITNNGDLKTVLGTIAAIVKDFTAEYPKSEIVIKGNSPAKQRLYQMSISNNLEDIAKEFHVYGSLLENGEFEIFEKGKNYLAISVLRK